MTKAYPGKTKSISKKQDFSRNSKSNGRAMGWKMNKFKQGYAKAQSEIEKDKFVIKCMEISKEVGYAKALDDVKKEIYELLYKYNNEARECAILHKLKQEIAKFHSQQGVDVKMPDGKHSHSGSKPDVGTGRGIHSSKLADTHIPKEKTK